VETGLDARVVGFALLLAVVTGAVFGVLPAVQASRVNLTSALKAETQASGLRGLGLRNGLVVAQVALSMVLLVGAGLFARTLRHALAADVTVDPGKVLLARLDPLTQGYDEARGKRFYPRLLERVQALPGVRHAALVWIVPLGGMRGGTDIVTELPERPGQQHTTQVDYNVISPDYFATVGLAVLRGRAFTDHDREGAPKVAVVNEQFARRFWPRQDSLSQRFRLAGRGSPDTEVVVAGVVRDGKFRNFREPVRPCFYLPLWQHWRGEVSLEVRAAGEPAPLSAAVGAAVRAIDRDLVLPEVLTLAAHRDLGLSQERLAAALLGGLGALALVLATLGVYGLLSFSVAQRTREIGIRLALGGRTAEVLRRVLRQGMVLVLIGIGIGLAVALALARFVASLLYEVSPSDATTLAGVSALLTAAAAVACLVPARRAARVNPVEALRYE
jgi:predicted permease